MANHKSIEFVTDESGNKRAVLIPLTEWEKIQVDLNELLEYRTMKESLKSAFSQVREIKQGELPKKTLKRFLDEC